MHSSDQQNIYPRLPEFEVQADRKKYTREGTGRLYPQLQVVHGNISQHVEGFDQNQKTWNRNESQKSVLHMFI